MTVEELITQLQKLPPKSDIYIGDSDTSWLLRVQYVGQAKDCKTVWRIEDHGDALIIAGNYDDFMQAPDTGPVSISN